MRTAGRQDIISDVPACYAFFRHVSQLIRPAGAAPRGWGDVGPHVPRLSESDSGSDGLPLAEKPRQPEQQGDSSCLERHTHCAPQQGHTADYIAAEAGPALASALPRRLASMCLLNKYRQYCSGEPSSR